MIEAMIRELEREAKTTGRVLERVPDDRLSWRPHPKSTPVGNLAWHIALLPWRIATMITREGTVDVTRIAAEPMPGSSQEMLAAFQRHVAFAKEKLGKLTDDQLGQELAMARGEVTMVKLPKVDFIRTVLLNHMVHHRGQLSVYLRLLEIPVPAIYGPTADES